MELRDAYRTLEVPTGATEDVVRDARKTLSKVWHPDRYTNDPDLQAKAETKLREINEAFEVVRGAGFPTAVPAAKPEPAATPPPRAPPPVAAPAPVPPVSSTVELVPRRRVRWSVILVLFAGLGIGAYFAILKLGAKPSTAARDAEPKPEAVIVAPADVSSVAVAIADAPAIDPIPERPLTGPAFTFGATQVEVVALQGEPNGTDSSSSSQSTTVNGHEVATSVSRTKLTYGRSEIDLVDDKVVGWWDNDVRLRVRIAPRDPAVVAAARARGTLAKGQTTDDVLGVLGTPNRVTKNRWTFGTTAIELDDTGRIVALGER